MKTSVPAAAARPAGAEALGLIYALVVMLLGAARRPRC